jgi:hypothetical protein
MRSIKKKISAVGGPGDDAINKAASVAAVKNEVRGGGKPGPRKETAAGPVKSASRKTHPKPPDGEC